MHKTVTSFILQAFTASLGLCQAPVGTVKNKISMPYLHETSSLGRLWAITGKANKETVPGADEGHEGSKKRQEGR